MQRDSGSGRPAVTLVSGAPGSGKTTLATLLAARLELPLLSKDAIKESLCEALGAPTVERSQEIGAAAYAALYEVLGRVLDAGMGAVVESNFRRGLSERELQPLAARCDVRLIHCSPSDATILDRYAARASDPGRHPAHHDLARVEDVRRDLAAGRFDPLHLDVPLLRVDTTSGYEPAFGAILAFAGARSAVPA